MGRKSGFCRRTFFVFSSAGSRVTYQRQFKTSSDEGTRSLIQRHARGNSLFRNEGDGRFRDVTEPSRTWFGRWAWGAQFVDLTGDGRDDLFVPNGFFTNQVTTDL